MLILTPYLTPRFRYAVHQVFLHLKGTIEFTQDEKRFSEYNGPKLEYSKVEKKQENFPVVHATEWLWNKEIYDEHIPDIKTENGQTKLFFRDGLSHDVFASVFWVLTRYEEYLPKSRDDHGRFASKYSVLSKDQANDLPWVDIWRKEFSDEVRRFFPQLVFEQPSLKLRMTVDVDSAFAYRHKGVVRTIGGMFKDVSKIDVRNLLSRIDIVIGSKHDPYDTYDYVADVCREKKIPLTWFFLLADPSQEDIGISHRNSAYRDVIKKLSSEFEFGIHPGYASNNDPGKIAIEKSRLEEIAGLPVTRSRQHYLKLAFPETYRRLIDRGIREDYTLGYADRTGYRAGTNYPFPWFDLEKNEETNLILHPFAVMDTTLRDYMKLSPDKAIEWVHGMIASARATGGEFNLLWHNESLSEMGKWQGWKTVWEKITDLK